jgi:hypothetical protein
MNEYPDYTYTQSAAQYNEWMADKYPALNDQIKQRIKEGRWEIVGGMWVEPDLNMPDGESLGPPTARRQRYFKQQYGVDVRIGWNPDSFGYNWQLPQIYKRSGIDYFVTQKMAWNDTNQLPFKLFWWQSPDGSRVLTYFPTTTSTTIEPHPTWPEPSPTRASAIPAPRDDAPLRHWATTAAAPPAPCSTPATAGSEPDKAYPSSTSAMPRASSPRSRKSSTPRTRRSGTTRPWPQG